MSSYDKTTLDPPLMSIEYNCALQMYCIYVYCKHYIV